MNKIVKLLWEQESFNPPLSLPVTKLEGERRWRGALRWLLENGFSRRYHGPLTLCGLERPEDLK